MTPEQAAEFARNWHDPMWRLCQSGMYRILVKDTEGNPDGSMPFHPNSTQLQFLHDLHYRNLILKARQRGLTTLVCLLWLDTALFNKNTRCGIVAQDDTAATSFFADKVKYAYDQLDPEIKAMCPLEKDSANELKFRHNNSSIRVATSFASATLHRLHISEYAKICVKYPEKAKEVVLGTLPTVPENGIIIIESTGEGAEGDFFERSQKSYQAYLEKRPLSPKDFKFHFYPWYEATDYVADPSTVTITPEVSAYLDRKETECGVTLRPEQRAWYAITLDGTFGGVWETMYSQYPTTPDEPFFVSTEGNYFRREMSVVRTQGRILDIPTVDAPVNTFWDIGNSDGCAVWFHQQIGMEDRFIGYYEAHGEKLGEYVKELQARGHVYNKHFLPHDAGHKRLSDTNKSLKEQLEALYPGQVFELVPRVTDLNQGIQLTRQAFGSAYFDRAGCALGLSRLDNYRKRWNNRDGRYSDEPDKSNGCSEGADAFRQWAQAKNRGDVTIRGATRQARAGRIREAPDWRL